LLFQSCDPGEKAHVATGRSLNAIALPIARVSILKELLHAGATLDASACVADELVAQATIAELNDPTGRAFTSPEGRQRIQQIASACKATIG
jgi:hypothetical protein